MDRSGGGSPGELPGAERGARRLIGFLRRSQVGTLHKSLVRAEGAALSPQCREASGLSADSLARAESLDKVLQQVSAGPDWVAAPPGRTGERRWQARGAPRPTGPAAGRGLL